MQSLRRCVIVRGCGRRFNHHRRPSHQHAPPSEAELAHLRSRKVTVRGVTFHVSESGEEGHTPVVCLPGALGTGLGDFHHQLEGLPPRGYHVITLDPRGYGKSRPPKRVFDIDFYQTDAEDVAAVMADLGIEQYNVLGWSDGANAAVHLAAKHPTRVERLVLFGGNSYVTAEDINAYEATRNVNMSWSTAMKTKNVPLYGKDLQPMWDSFCDAMKAFYDKGGDICQEEARKIQCPTLVIHGSKDPLVPMVHPAWFEQNIPDCRTYYFPDGKHNVHVKYHQQFNGLIENFF